MRRWGAKIAAAALSLALVAVSPGVGTYQALAQTAAGRAASASAPAAPPLPSSLTGSASSPNLDLSIPLADPAQGLLAPTAPPIEEAAIRTEGSAPEALPLKRPRPTAAAELPAANDSRTRNAENPDSPLASAIQIERAGGNSGHFFDLSLSRIEAGAGIPGAGASVFSPPDLAPRASFAAAASGRGVPSPNAPSAAAPLHPIVRYGIPAAALAAAVYFAGGLPLAALAGAAIASILVHEAGHLWALRHWGDSSRADRKSLNPLLRIDPLGTLLVPALSMLASTAILGVPVFIGWARHVHVHIGPREIDGGGQEPAKVTMAGPAMNLALAALAGAALPALPAAGAAALVLAALFKANLALAAFNLLPFPWLDGGKLLLSRVLPPRLFEAWVSRPKLHHLDDLHPLTRVALLGAIGALSSFLFSFMGLPFLFLALPCGFDYYCIYEKVRSPQAVQNMMGLMSKWGGLLYTIAEEKGARTEVNKDLAERALVYAVDKLAEKLMADPAFAVLPESEKIARFMAAFPGFAVPVLHEHVFTEDDLSMVQAIFADPRNAEYMDGLRAWLANPDNLPAGRTAETFFQMMARTGSTQTAEERERFIAEIKKRAQFGGSAMSALLPFLLLLPAGLAGVFGTLQSAEPPSSPDPMGKLRSLNVTGWPDGRLCVSFLPGLEREHVDAFLDRLRLTAEPQMRRRLSIPNPGPGEASFYYSVELTVPDAEAAARLALGLARSALVKGVILQTAAMVRVQGAEPADLPPVSLADLTAAPLSNVRADAGLTDVNTFWVAFEPPLAALEESNSFLIRHRLNETRGYEWENQGRLLRVKARTYKQAQVLVREIAAERGVERVTIHPQLEYSLPQSGRDPETLDMASALGIDRMPEEPLQKLQTISGEAQSQPQNTGKFWITFQPGTEETEISRLVELHLKGPGASPVPHETLAHRLQLRVDAANGVRAQRLVLALGREAAVRKIAVHRSIYERLLGHSSSVDPSRKITVMTSLSNPRQFKVYFAPGLGTERRREILIRHGVPEGGWEDVPAASPAVGYTVVLSREEGDASQAAARAAALAGEPSVNQVAVSAILRDEMRNLSEAGPGAPAEPPAPPSEPPDPLGKASPDASLSAQELRVAFAPRTSGHDVRDFLYSHALRRSITYSIEEGPVLILQVPNDAAAAAIAAGAARTDGVSSLRLPPERLQALEAMRQAQGDSAFGNTPSPGPEIPAAADEARALLARFKPEASEQARQDYLKRFDLRPVAAEYGETNLALLELPDKVDVAWALAVIQEQAAAADSPVLFIRPLRQPAPAPQAAPETAAPQAPKEKLAIDDKLGPLALRLESASEGSLKQLRVLLGERAVAEEGAQNLSIEAPSMLLALAVLEMLLQDSAVSKILVHPEVARLYREMSPSQAPAAPPRRDVQAAWLEFLKSRGKGGKLTGEDVEFLAAYLKPVVADAPVIGRVQEILDALRAITGPRGMKNSAILTGPPGVGKTAIARGIAHIYQDVERAFSELASQGADLSHMRLDHYKGRWLVELDADLLLNPPPKMTPMGPMQIKPVEVLRELKRLLALLNGDDPRRGNDVAVFVDEYHMIKPLSQPLLKPMLKGELSLLGAATDANYKKYVEDDPAFSERAYEVQIKEPSLAETIRMLRGSRRYLEDLLGAVFPDEVLVQGAKLSAQFQSDRKNPRKSEDLLADTAKELRADTLRLASGAKLRDTWKELAEAVFESVSMLKKKALETASLISMLGLPSEVYNTLHNRVAGLVAKAVSLHEQRGAVPDGPPVVTLSALRERLGKITGNTGSGQLMGEDEDLSRYIEMEAEIGKDVKGQDHAIAPLAQAVRRYKAGLSEPGKPIGKFIFAGPTGVGKTHLAKKLAKFLFGDENLMVRLDMSEYMEKHQVARLIGAPPGYVGYEEGGQLTGKIKKNPYCVLLLDEIEKAHPDFFNIMLQILDDGRLTDSKTGEAVDFKNVFILATTNAGMELIDMASFAERLRAARTKLAAASAAAVGLSKRQPALDAALAPGELRVRFASGIQPEQMAIALARNGLPAQPPGAQDPQAVSLRFTDPQQAAQKASALAKDIAVAKVLVPPDAAERMDGSIAQAEGEVHKVNSEWKAAIDAAVSRSIAARFRPEFLNRWDRVPDPNNPDGQRTFTVMNMLDEPVVRDIARLKLREQVERLRERHDTEFEYGEAVLDLLVRVGFDPVFGARPMADAIMRLVIDPISAYILKEMQSGKSAVRGGKVTAAAADGKISFSVEEKPPKPVERATLAGICAELTREVLDLIELGAFGAPDVQSRLPEPSEGLFSGLFQRMRAALGEEKAAPSRAQPATEPLLRRDAALTLLPETRLVPGEGGNPNAKDPALRAEETRIVEAARGLGWPEEALSLLETPASAPSVGWIRRFTRLAKAWAKAPVELAGEVSPDLIRVLIHSPRAMDVNPQSEERQSFERHFTGTPPADFTEAQQRANELGFQTGKEYDRDLLDLHRRLARVPGARMGFASGAKARGGGGTDYWIELAKPAQAAAASTKQTRERERILNDLLLKQILLNAQDGPMLRASAARAYALLAGPERAREARVWVLERGWYKSIPSDDAPLAMAMAGVLELYGAPADIPVLEGIAEKITDDFHYLNPVKASLVRALAALYARSGEAAVRRNLESDNKTIKRAAQLALGRIGSAADVGLVKDDPDAFAALAARLGPQWREDFLYDKWPPQPNPAATMYARWDSAAFKKMPEYMRIAVLRMVAQGTRHTAKDIEALHWMLHKKITDDREALYAAAEAFADIAIANNLTGRLPQAFERHLNHNSVTGSADDWPVLLALVHVAARARDPEALPFLEEIMKKGPTGISAVQEQAFYESADAWARTVVLSGKYADYARPRQGQDGAAKPSILEEMLTSDHPLRVSAAAYAVALQESLRSAPTLGAQDPNAPPKGNLPDIVTAPSSP